MRRATEPSPEPSQICVGDTQIVLVSGGDGGSGIGVKVLPERRTTVLLPTAKTSAPSPPMSMNPALLPPRPWSVVQLPPAKWKRASPSPPAYACVPSAQMENRPKSVSGVADHIVPSKCRALVVPLATHTSPGATAQTVKPSLAVDCAHALPFQWKIALPTAHTSLLEVP